MNNFIKSLFSKIIEFFSEKDIFLERLEPLNHATADTYQVESINKSEERYENSFLKLRYIKTSFSENKPYYKENFIVRTLVTVEMSNQSPTDGNLDLYKLKGIYKTSNIPNSLFFKNFNERIVNRWNDFIELHPKSKDVEKWFEYLKKTQNQN